LQNPSSDKHLALNLIASQISIHKLIAASIFCISVISATIFFCYVIGNSHVPLLPSVGMLILLTSLWIINSHHAEMANRYQSHFEKVAKQEDPKISLYVKRPITENVSAMWNRAEMVFFIGVVLIVTFITYDF